MNVHDAVDLIGLFSVAARTASANGTGVDAKDYVGKMKCVLLSSIGGGTTPTLDVKLQGSADNSSFADIAGATFTQVTDAAASAQSIGLIIDSARRYIRAVATIAGDTPTFTFGVQLLGRKQEV